MGKLINLSINLDKIDKNKIIKGQKGNYLNVTVSVNDSKDEHGNDVAAWIGQSKEETTAKAPKTYLGNGRVFWQSNEVQQSSNDDKMPWE